MMMESTDGSSEQEQERTVEVREKEEKRTFHASYASGSIFEKEMKRRWRGNFSYDSYYSLKAFGMLLIC